MNLWLPVNFPVMEKKQANSQIPATGGLLSPQQLQKMVDFFLTEIIYKGMAFSQGVGEQSSESQSCFY